MKNSLLFIAFVIIIGCSKIEPRRPINPKPSTTLFKEAIDESKKINKTEDLKIAELIKKDSTNFYIQSSSGFWYTYIYKIEEVLPTPKKGDEIGRAHV